jgi:hypothetical protein
MAVVMRCGTSSAIQKTTQRIPMMPDSIQAIAWIFADLITTAISPAILNAVKQCERGYFATCELSPETSSKNG